MSILMEIELSDYSYKEENQSNYELSTIMTEKDEREWEVIISKVFDFECNIEKNLKNEEIYNPKRVFILRDGEKIVATASAWYRQIYGEEYGYLHMVAVDSDYRGKGLSYLVVNEAIKFMKNEGRKKVILKTDDFRKAAIKVYTNLGFKIKDK